MDRVCACIIARLNSTRLPRKVLADISGKPLLKWIVDRMRAVEGIDDVVLCTSDHPEDEELLEYAKEWDVPALAGSQENIVSRLQQAARTFNADILLRATGDNPLVAIDHTEKLVEAHKRLNAEYSRVHPLPLGGTVGGISEDVLPKIQDELPSPSHSEYLVVYAFNPERYECVVLFPPESVRRPYYSITVDTPDDLALVRRIYKKVDGSSVTGPSIQEVVRVLDEDDSYEGISGSAAVKMPDEDQISYDDFLERMNDRVKESTVLSLE